MEEVGRCWSKVNIQLRVSSGDLMYIMLTIVISVFLKFVKITKLKNLYRKAVLKLQKNSFSVIYTWAR